jgi:hypothetical protein
MTKATETKLLSLDDFDLSTASDTPFDLEVLNTKGVKTALTLQVLGSESEKVQEWTNRQANRIRTQATQKSVTGKEKVRTAEEDDEYIIESAVVRVIGWSGLAEPFNKENVTRLMARNVHARMQVLQASNELGNYSKD